MASVVGSDAIAFAIYCLAKDGLLSQFFKAASSHWWKMDLFFAAGYSGEEGSSVALSDKATVLEDRIKNEELQ